MFEFVVTDGRPWYKQAVSGILKGLVLGILLLLLYAEPGIIIVVGSIWFIVLLAELYCWAIDYY